MEQKPVPTLDHAAEEREQAGQKYLHVKCPTCGCEFGLSGVADDKPGFVHCRQCGQPLQVTKKGG